MLRFVRLKDRALSRTVGPRGLTLLVVALAAGGCSAGFDRLGPLNYSGGPTGSATLVPPAPMEAPRMAPAPQPDYAPPYRPDYRSDYRSDSYRSSAPQGSDNTVRMAGLPEPYDRGQPTDRAPIPHSASPSVPYDTPRVSARPSSTPPAPPRASFDPPTPVAQPDGTTIEVRPGDTLYALSKTHRVPVSELMRVNNLSGPQLKVGQKLVLPVDSRRARRVAALPTTPAPDDSTPADYVPPPAYVPPTPAPRSAAPRAAAPAPMPTLPPVSADSGPMVPPLVETPPATPPPAVAASPAPSAPSPRAEVAGWTGTYTVQRGDSLFAIARKHGIKLNELERVNEITNPRKVMPGTVLKVPKPGDTARAAPVPPTPAAPAPQAVAEKPSTITVKPTIINPGSRATPEDRTRVAALNPPSEATDAPPIGAPEQPAARPMPAPSQDATAPAPKTAALSKFRWPARGKIITAFGAPAAGGPNDGINISVPRGTDIHAAEGGVVTYAGDGVQGYGSLVLIRHPEGWITAYAHNDALMVKTGDSVRRGQIIAKAGNSGSVSQPQLHFQIRQGPTPVDPMQHLER